LWRCPDDNLELATRNRLCAPLDCLCPVARPTGEHVEAAREGRGGGQVSEEMGGGHMVGVEIRSECFLRKQIRKRTMGANKINCALPKSDIAHPQFQVAWSVIIPHTVLVVNRFAPFQCAPQLLFQYDSSSAYLPATWNSNNDIATSVFVFLPRLVLLLPHEFLSPTLTAVRKRVSFCFPIPHSLKEGEQNRRLTCETLLHAKLDSNIKIGLYQEVEVCCDC